MRAAFFAVLFTLSFSQFASAEEVNHSPRLLLTAQRLRRLKRDRERQTIRWINFENRVQFVPNSPERGFELALYYAVAGDEQRGREAVRWALAHLCDYRQVALVLDWAGALATDAERAKLSEPACTWNRRTQTFVRDQLFMTIAIGRDPTQQISNNWKPLLADTEDLAFQGGDLLYAVCEYLSAVRFTQNIDLREDSPQFFSSLPIEFLLSLDPGKIEHPSWMTHIAALALVALDPNLESSQYVQGWAMEERQMIREGPGVGYEFLWADPYLPGVGYQNLDPWVYDLRGRLFARSDWSPDACWISISANRIQDENCPHTWRTQPVVFGRSTLIPMLGACVQVPHRQNNETAIVWQLRPKQTLSFTEDKLHRTIGADSVGLCKLPANVEGKLCAVP